MFASTPRVRVLWHGGYLLPRRGTMARSPACSGGSLFGELVAPRAPWWPRRIHAWSRIWCTSGVRVGDVGDIRRLSRWCRAWRGRRVPDFRAKLGLALRAAETFRGDGRHAALTGTTAYASYPSTSSTLGPALLVTCAYVLLAGGLAKPAHALGVRPKRPEPGWALAVLCEAVLLITGACSRIARGSRTRLGLRDAGHKPQGRISPAEGFSASTPAPTARRCRAPHDGGAPLVVLSSQPGYRKQMNARANALPRPNAIQ